MGRGNRTGEGELGKGRGAAGPGVQWRARVLVAEDNIVNQKVAARMLEKLGCRVDVAANGVEVLEALRNLTYDIVFMDCQMPEMDGYEATAAIRKEEQAENSRLGTGESRPVHTPIIAMTANAMQGDRDKCLDAGMDDYTSKPVKSEELVGMLRKWVPGEKAHEGVAVGPDGPMADPAGAAPAKGPPLDAQYIAALTEFRGDGGCEFVLDLIARFIREATTHIEPLRAAARAGDCEVLERAAHVMKSGCSCVGAMEMAGVCQQLQMLGQSGSVVGAGALIERLEMEFARVREALDGECSRIREAQKLR